MIFGMFLISGTYTESHSATRTNEVNAIKGTGKIDLEGDLDNKGGLRSGTDPIVAELQGNVLLVLFQKDVGTLQVTVTGPQGVVYATSVNTQTPNSLSIPLMGQPAGNYTITFANQEGMMWGEFEL